MIQVSAARSIRLLVFLHRRIIRLYQYSLLSPGLLSILMLTILHTMAATQSASTAMSAISVELSPSHHAYQGSPEGGYIPSDLHPPQPASLSSSVSDRNAEDVDILDDISSDSGRRPGVSSHSSTTSVGVLTSGQRSPVIWREPLPTLPTLAEATLKASQTLEKARFELPDHVRSELEDAFPLNVTSERSLPENEWESVHAALRNTDYEALPTVPQKDYSTLITRPEAARTIERSARALSPILSSQDDVISPIDQNDLLQPAPARFAPSGNPERELIVNLDDRTGQL